jgi:hypothetical protein
LFRNANQTSYAKGLASNRRKKQGQKDSNASSVEQEPSCISSAGSSGSLSPAGRFNPELLAVQYDEQSGSFSDIQDLNASRPAEPASSVTLSRADGARVVSTLLSISPPLRLHLENYSIPLILCQLSAPLGGGRLYGILHFLPDLYQHAYEDSCLTLATNAVARAYLTNQVQSEADTRGQVQVYGKALRSTNLALQDSYESIQDATLMAIWLLGIHEVCDPLC